MTIRTKIIISNLLIVFTPFVLLFAMGAVWINTAGRRYWKPIEEMYEDSNGVISAQNLIYAYQEELWDTNWAELEEQDEGPADGQLHDFVTAFAPYPVVEEGQRNYTQGGYGDLLSINPKSEHIEEAWEFAKWYATEGMLPMAEGGRVPSSNTYDLQAVTDAFLKGAEEIIEAESTQKVLIAPADNYAVPSITNHIAEVKKVLTEELELIFIGEKTVEQGMADAKTRADEILNQ